MIWPFSSKSKEIKIPEFEGIQFVDNEGNRWKYKPVKHITPLEVAKLLPLFASVTMMGVDRISYIKKEKLERNFEITPKAE